MPRKKKEEVVAVVEEKKPYSEVLDYLLSINGNDNYFTVASDYLKSNNLIRDYIPYEMRKEVAKEIVNTTCYKNGEFIMDSSYLRALSCATELVLYLNVEWPENIDYMAVYDMYIMLGFSTLLNIDYYNGLAYLCDAIVSDIQLNEFSVSAQLRSLLLKIDASIDMNTSEMVNNPEFITLLSNKLMDGIKENKE